MMKLWTPPTPRIAKPHACGVCGGVRPEWMQENRRRAGFILLMACCCKPPGCVPSVELTVSGVDAGACDTCPDGYRVASLNVDGTYVLDFLVEQTIGGRIACLYLDNSSQPGAAVEESCLGLVTSYDLRNHFVRIWKDTGTIAKVNIGTQRGGNPQWALEWPAGVSNHDATGAAIGAIIPNDLTCAFPARIWSSTGTVVVSLP